MNRIVAASCDAAFYPAARDLVASIQSTNADVVQGILFFDLGLLAPQRREMDAIPGVRVLDYPPSLAKIYPDFLTPRMFAWKTYVMQESQKYAAAVLYMDCGCVVLQSLLEIFESIERNDVFLVRDVHPVNQRTHAQCLSILAATAQERAAMQIDAGVMGIRAGGKYARMFSQGFDYAGIRACIFGDAAAHRHDQSIYSVLAVRHGVKRIHPYGRLVHWRGIQTPDQVIWQHRGKWPAFRRLRERGAAAVAGKRLALYGAGMHTGRFLPTIRHLLEPRHALVGIIDDAPSAAQLEGIKVLPTADWRGFSPDIVIVSSDAHEAAMMEKGRMIFQEIPVWGIYGD